MLMCHAHGDIQRCTPYSTDKSGLIKGLNKSVLVSFDSK